LHPDLIAVRTIFNRHNIITGIGSGRVTSDVGVVG
jgi:hypothetical protein